ncbi:hypothetical protein ACFYTG_38720 [Streptomyces mirabilis]|uniref:hypothetical protein n=1 Tax=Streptomyces mirabilis TaxID=68239 RepID=UPI00369F9C6F
MVKTLLDQLAWRLAGAVAGETSAITCESGAKSTSVAEMQPARLTKIGKILPKA